MSFAFYDIVSERFDDYCLQAACGADPASICLRLTPGAAHVQEYSVFDSYFQCYAGAFTFGAGATRIAHSISGSNQAAYGKWTHSIWLFLFIY